MKSRKDPRDLYTHSICSPVLGLLHACNASAQVVCTSTLNIQSSAFKRSFSIFYLPQVSPGSRQYCHTHCSARAVTPAYRKASKTHGQRQALTRLVKNSSFQILAARKHVPLQIALFICLLISFSLFPF